MLVRLSKVASERAVCNKQSQIKQKKYSTIVRAVGDEHIVPDTTVLKRVLAEAGSQKSLADAYKEVLEKQNKFRTELLNDVSSTLSQSPYGSVRSAAADLTAVVQQITSEVALDITGATLPAQSLDETLQVHEIGELYSQYAKAFAALPYVKTEVPVPIDAVAESFAPVVRFFSKRKIFFCGRAARAFALLKPPQAHILLLLHSVLGLTLFHSLYFQKSTHSTKTTLIQRLHDAKCNRPQRPLLPFAFLLPTPSNLLPLPSSPRLILPPPLPYTIDTDRSPS